MTNKHFDTILELGFDIDISWNKSLTIYYIIDDFDIVILHSDYNIKSFDNFIDLCIDFFYEWYNKNKKLISKLEFDNSNTIEIVERIEESALGNITKRVNRELNLDKLL